jgi:hypothetical protein
MTVFPRKSIYRNPRPVTSHWLPEPYKIPLTTDCVWTYKPKYCWIVAYIRHPYHNDCFPQEYCYLINEFITGSCSLFIEVVQQKSDCFSINWLSTKWKHHLFLRVSKLNTSIWESVQRFINMRGITTSMQSVNRALRLQRVFIAQNNYLTEQFFNQTIFLICLLSLKTKPFVPCLRTKIVIICD